MVDNSPEVKKRCTQRHLLNHRTGTIHHSRCEAIKAEVNKTNFEEVSMRLASVFLARYKRCGICYANDCSRP